MSTNPNPDLMRIFDFTAEDLEANRAGRLSEMQKSILIKGIRDQRPLIKKSLIRFPVIGFLYSLVYFSPDDIQHWLSATATFIVVLFLIAILFSIFVYRGIVNREKLLKADKVEVAIGTRLGVQVWYKRRSFTFNNAYWIQTSDLRFPISRKRFDELGNDLEQEDKNVSYLLYHPANSKWLLSLEVVDQ